MTDLERDQTAMFDVVMGEIVAPMDRAEPEPAEPRPAPLARSEAADQSAMDTGAEPGQLADTAPADDDFKASPDDVQAMFGRFTEEREA